MATINKDNKLMALLSVWGILLVLLGHSGFEEPIIQQKLHYLHGWIYSFHMPLFFMISGYLYSLTNRNFIDIRAGQFMRKKAVRLLVPYVVLGVILYGIKYVFSGLSHASRVFSVGTFFKMFISPGCEGSTMGYLWYVFTLFMVFAIVVTLNRVHIDLKKPEWCFVLIVIFGMMSAYLSHIGWFNWNTVCRDFPYFIVGILLHRYESKILMFINGGVYFNLLIFSVLSVIMLFVDLPCTNKIEHLLEAFIGLAMSIQLCSMLLHCEWVVRFILPLAKYTYCIYLLSWFGHYAAKIVLVNLMHVHWAIVVLAMFVAGFLLPLIVCQMMTRINWLNKQKWLHLVIGY